MNRSLAFLLGLAMLAWAHVAAGGTEPSATHIYRNTGAKKFALDLYTPASAPGTGARPAVIFFHGGGWKSGNRRQFARQAALLTSQTPLIVISADYPLNSDPIESTEAAQAAVCWVRMRAQSLGIDPKRIALAGGSAGGQLATAVALLPKPTAPECQRVAGPYANALLLYNPVLELTGKWQRRMGGELASVSPMALVTSPLPPTVIFQGTADKTSPLSQAQRFVEKAQANGSTTVKLFEYPGRDHGFFNDDPDFEPVVRQSIDFLKEQRWF